MDVNILLAARSPSFWSPEGPRIGREEWVRIAEQGRGVGKSGVGKNGVGDSNVSFGKKEGR